MGDFPLCRKSHFPWPFLPVLSLFIWFLTSCAPQATPDLLELQSIDPPTLESGTELQIVGNGFPENRPGRLILKGTAYVPARQPEAVEWQIPLYPDSGSSIHLRLSEKMLGEQLKGAAHATFRGQAEVVFEPIGSGRPILRGTKKEMVLDLFTAESAEPVEAVRFLDFLGLKVSEALLVTEIMKDSRAAQAGLAVGDKLHSLDHVRLDSFSDVVPQARAQTSVIEYSRDGFRGHAEAHIERTEFQILDKSLAARSLAAIGAVMLALLLAARPPRFLVWLVGSKTSARKGTVTWLAGVGTRSQTLAYPLFLTVVVGFWWLAGRTSMLLTQWDFMLCLAVGLLLLFVSSFLLGGKRTKGSGFSLLGATSSTLSRALVLLPVVMAACVRASEVGSLRLRDLENVQGAGPGSWALFDSPWSFVLGLSFLVALAPLAGRRAPLEGHPGNTERELILARALEWMGHLVLLALWIAIFAGGISGRWENSLVSGALFSGKLAVSIQCLCWMRARSGGLRLGETWGLFGGANLGCAVVGTALSFGTLALGLREAHAEVLGLFAITLAACVMLLFVVSSQRSWGHMGRRIDPWI